MREIIEALTETLADIQAEAGGMAVDKYGQTVNQEALNIALKAGEAIERAKEALSLQAREEPNE